MRATVRAVCRPEVAPGFALAGLAPIAVTGGEQAGAAVAQLAEARDRGGVILIERELFDDLPAALRRRIRREGVPILVPFPGPALAGPGRAPAEEYVLEILRRAVGYRVRLR